MRGPVTSKSLRAVAFGNGRFVATGESGTILQSGQTGPRLELKGIKAGRAELKVLGEPGKRYRIESSIDLVSWGKLSEFNSADALDYTVFDDSAGDVRKYYRLILD